VDGNYIDPKMRFFRIKTDKQSENAIASHKDAEKKIITAKNKISTI